jgi:hypothetical protein
MSTDQAKLKPIWVDSVTENRSHHNSAPAYDDTITISPLCAVFELREARIYKVVRRIVRSVVRRW